MSVRVLVVTETDYLLFAAHWRRWLILCTCSRLDLVKLVDSYLFFATASAGATPKLLLTMNHFDSWVFGVACSPGNKIWAVCQKHVQVFSEDGKFLYNAAKGQWRAANGIAFDADGHAYIADFVGHCIVVCRPDGSFAGQFGSFGHKDVEFDGPSYVAIDQERQMLFVTEGHKSVSMLTLDGTFVRAIGSQGKGESQFDRPRGVAINSAGEVGVCDNGGDRVLVYNREGTFLRTFASFGEEEGQVNDLWGLASPSAAAAPASPSAADDDEAELRAALRASVQAPSSARSPVSARPVRQADLTQLTNLGYACALCGQLDCVRLDEQSRVCICEGGQVPDCVRPRNRSCWCCVSLLMAVFWLAAMMRLWF